jgi:hypothetical protein
MKPPLFPVGFPLNVGYMGLTDADVPPFTASGKTVEPTPIQGIRLLPNPVHDCPDGDDGEQIVTIEHASGWEYQIAYIDGRGRWQEDGWWTEAELLKRGYVPPTVADGDATAADAHADSAPVG